LSFGCVLTWRFYHFLEQLLYFGHGKVGNWQQIGHKLTNLELSDALQFVLFHIFPLHDRFLDPLPSLFELLADGRFLLDRVFKERGHGEEVMNET
jgi:hypothetical protein